MSQSLFAHLLEHFFNNGCNLIRLTDGIDLPKMSDPFLHSLVT